MLVSMTGFGRAEVPLASPGRAVVEVRSLNHRFLEVETRLPEGFQVLEEGVRAAVGRALQRGQVRVSISVRTLARPANVVLQADVARRYAAQLRRLQGRLGLSGPLTLETVLSLPQVVMVADRGEPSRQDLRQVRLGLQRALGQVTAMRRREGARTETTLAGILKRLDSLRARAQKRLPEVQNQMKERFLARVEKALARAAAGGAEGSGRSALLSEASAYAQSGDVSEELARIASHLAALRAATSGRTIDFLAQELQREVNTLGTKVRDAQVVRAVVAMKSLIEKLREQAANVE
ncbi:MAG: YicC family protein [Candidatus Omnitrophica bacterium]|nr:YicC family protein [Candidatus Omnitrophota bacterium]